MATWGSRGAVLVAALAAGCAGPRAAEQPPVAPVPTESASIRKPTLLVQTLYTPELTLRVRLDGAPAEGPARLVPVPPGDEAMFADQDQPPDGSIGTLELEAKGGDIVLLAPDVDAASKHEAFVLTIGGHTYALPRVALREPLWCAQTVAAVRGIDPCSSPLPSGSAPEVCDRAGAAAWESAREAQMVRRDGCWTKLDEATIAGVRGIGDMALRQAACDRMLSLAGPGASGEEGLRLFDACERQMPPSLRQALLPEKRRRDLPEAFELARSGSSEQMRLFVRDYEVTGDARVAQMRAIALERFGPKDRARFQAIAAAVAAVRSNDGRYARLCDIAGDQAEVVVKWAGEHVSWQDPEVGEAEAPLDEERGAGPARGQRARVIWPRRKPRPQPPDTYTPRLVALVKARARVRTVRLSTRCAIDHWYLETRPPRAR